MELEEGNGALQRENEELHTATLPPGPAYSTPYRLSGPPSLHDEISRHGNLSDNALSPLVEVDHRHGNSKESFQSDGSFGNLSLEDLEHIARNSVGHTMYILFDAHHLSQIPTVMLYLMPTMPYCV